ncbi:hypothetical protein Salat_1687500 [Sesamum alatum]|uniref:Uncharacterized protein n=1 Tax=Sesamum alatum TaxID=300844 RepID=A0AAE2CK64_9LAMI|nr:hypothetical protein Salat_1687500 [Sesamum alatum]
MKLEKGAAHISPSWFNQSGEEKSRGDGPGILVASTKGCGPQHTQPRRIKQTWSMVEAQKLWPKVIEHVAQGDRTHGLGKQGTWPNLTMLTRPSGSSGWSSGQERLGLLNVGPT